jgi:hypothetical protein
MARRRRGNGRKTFKCGHKGKGQDCNRCEYAGKLKSIAEAGTKFVTNKKNPDKKLHRTWTKKELLAESERLLEGVRLL